jgi:MFS family permease
MALGFYGLGTSAGNVTFSSTIQTHVPAQIRGRVFSAFDLIWQAMRLASLVLGGLLADTFGIRAVFYLAAHSSSRQRSVASSLLGPSPGRMTMRTPD